MKQKVPAPLPEWASLTREICLALPYDQVKERKDELALRSEFLLGLDGIIKQTRQKVAITPEKTVFKESSESGLMRHLRDIHFVPNMMEVLGPEFSDIDTYFLKGYPMRKLADIVLGILRDEPAFPVRGYDVQKGELQTVTLRPKEALKQMRRGRGKIEYRLGTYLGDMLVVLKYVHHLDPACFSKTEIPPSLLQRFNRISLKPFFKRKRLEVLLHDDVVENSPDVLEYVKEYHAKVLSTFQTR